MRKVKDRALSPGRSMPKAQPPEEGPAAPPPDAAAAGQAADGNTDKSVSVEPVFSASAAAVLSAPTLSESLYGAAPDSPAQNPLRNELSRSMDACHRVRGSADDLQSPAKGDSAVAKAASTPRASLRSPDGKLFGAVVTDNGGVESSLVETDGGGDGFGLELGPVQRRIVDFVIPNATAEAAVTPGPVAPTAGPSWSAESAAAGDEVADAVAVAAAATEIPLPFYRDQVRLLAAQDFVTVLVDILPEFALLEQQFCLA